MRRRGIRMLWWSGVAATAWTACSAGDRDRGPRGAGSDTEVETPTSDPDDDPTDTATGPTDAGFEPLEPVIIGHIVAAAQAFAVEASALDLAPVTEAIQASQSLEGNGCPKIEDTPVGPGWLQEDCVTPFDFHYFGTQITVVLGWADFVREDLRPNVLEVWGPVVDPGWSDDMSPPDITATGYFAVCSVDRKDMALHLSGTYQDVLVSWGNVAIEQILLEGAVANPWSEMPDSWVAREVVPNLVRTRVTGPSGARVHVYHGAVSGLDTGYGTVWATDLALGNAAANDACPAEPQGVLSVRDVDGVWFDLVFDGDSGGPCDGCGAIERAGWNVGSACPDLGALLAPADGTP